MDIQALRPHDLNEIRVGATESASEVVAAVHARLRESGLDPRRARWIAPVGGRTSLPAASYTPHTPREAIWAIERALTAVDNDAGPVIAWLPASSTSQREIAGARLNAGARLVRRLRSLARARGATTVVLRTAN